MHNKKIWLEELAVVFKHLKRFENGYESGDFSEILPLLTRDCVFEFMWSIRPIKGYAEISKYFTQKSEAMKKAKNYPICYIAELVEKTKCKKHNQLYLNGERISGSTALRYQPGELCLIIEEWLNNELIKSLLRLAINEKGKIERIERQNPELFDYRCLEPYVTILPRSGEEEIKAGLIRIGEGYFSELYLFLRMVDECFDEYYNISISMNKWREALEKWKLFYSFESFDDALEYATGIDYESFTVKDKKALDILSRVAHSIWENRRTNPWIISALIEWTEKYKLCDSISSYGF